MPQRGSEKTFEQFVQYLNYLQLFADDVAYWERLFGRDKESFKVLLNTLFYNTGILVCSHFFKDPMQ